MKKHSAFLMLLASAAILLGSCAKEEAAEREDEKVISLDVPGNLQSSDDSGIVTLSWSAVDRADGYVWEIYDWNSVLKATSKTQNLSVSVEQLYTGKGYTARVKAVAGTKSGSDFSESIKFFPGGSEIIFFTGKSSSPGFKWSSTDSVLVSDGITRAVYVPLQTDTAVTELGPVSGEPLLDIHAEKYTAIYPSGTDDIRERRDTMLYSTDIPSINASATTDAVSKEFELHPSGGILRLCLTNLESLRLLGMKVSTAQKICAGDTLVMDFSKSEVTLSQTPLDIRLLMPSGTYPDLKLLFSAEKAVPDPYAFAQSVTITDGDTTTLSAVLDLHSTKLNLVLSYKENILTAVPTVAGKAVSDAIVRYETGYDSVSAVPDPTDTSAVFPSGGIDMNGTHRFVKAFAVRGETRTEVMALECNGLNGVHFGASWDFHHRDSVGTWYKAFYDYCASLGGSGAFKSKTFVSDELQIQNNSNGTFSLESTNLKITCNVGYIKHSFIVGEAGNGKLVLHITKRENGSKKYYLNLYRNGEVVQNIYTLPDYGSTDPAVYSFADVKAGEEIAFSVSYARIYNVAWEKDE